MRAQNLPVAAGWNWILAGIALYRRSPTALAMLVVLYWFIVLFLNVLPLLGPLLASMAIPALSVGLMQAARHAERGLAIAPAVLFSALRESGRSLFALGALYLCATLGALAVSALVDGGSLFQFMLADTKAERAAFEDADFTLSAALVMLLLVPVVMAWWFAPVLVAWHRLSLGKALFFSLIACAMNWRPFLAYGLGLIVVAGIAPALVLGLLLAVIPAAGAFLVGLAVLPLALVVAPAVFASFYACYRDIFGISEIV